jgi:hypothetical protein
VFDKLKKQPVQTQLLGRDKLTAAEYAPYCDLVITFYEGVRALPFADAVKLLRNLYTAAAAEPDSFAESSAQSAAPAPATKSDRLTEPSPQNAAPPQRTTPSAAPKSYPMDPITGYPIPPSRLSGGTWVVHLSAQKTEGEAQSAFRALQTKYYSLLGAHDP